MKKKTDIIAACICMTLYAYRFYDEFLLEVGFVLILALPIVLLWIFDRIRDARLERKQHKEGSHIYGRVHAPVVLRGGLLVCGMILWVAVLLILSTTYESFLTPERVCLFSIGLLLIFRYGMGIIWIEIIYNENEVIRKRGLGRKVYDWSEFGEVMQFRECMTFFDQNGKKLFTISRISDGFTDFYNLYRGTRPFNIKE